MFASLSSFLPSALQQVSPAACPQNGLPPSPTATPAVPVVEPPRKKEKRERKEKHANEAFIVVRPPPSKSTHPLSLQVQLVPPQSRNDRPVQALDSSPDDLDTDLKRTHSNRSETSNFSGYNSAGSTSSFASTSTSGSGRRMIIPLYNLNVHAVMPTTILDAGTDAKVAKFAKRGLEIMGLAFLEPIEVRSSAPANGSIAAPVSARPSFDSLHEFGSTPALSPPRHPVAADRPNTSHVPISAFGGSRSFKPTINLTLAPPLPPPDQPPQRSTKKLFTKMFRKKEAPSSLPIPIPIPNEVVSPQPSPLDNGARRSEETPALQLDAPLLHDTWSCTPLTSTTTSQTAILGVYPTLYPSVSNPKGRPTKYIWVVRKWLKGTDTNILIGMMGKLSTSSRDASAAHNTPLIEVRFEWCKGQKKGTGRKPRADKSTNAREGHSPARRRMSSNVPPRNTSVMLSPDVQDKRSSLISHNSSGSDTAASMVGSAHRHADESDEESDPEDSETPWTCTVVVQTLGHAPQHHQNNVREPVIRLKVATLAPTPHHPKVVGLLKMPFPLPDIELDSLVVRSRVVTAQGISKTTTTDTSDFVLTAEEIKDTVSSTALWLVVREAFGGVGRERKKGKS